MQKAERLDSPIFMKLLNLSTTVQNIQLNRPLGLTQEQGINHFLSRKLFLYQPKIINSKRELPPTFDSIFSYLINTLFVRLSFTRLLPRLQSPLNFLLFRFYSYFKRTLQPFPPPNNNKNRPPPHTHSYFIFFHLH